MTLSVHVEHPELFIEEASRLLAHFAREASLVFLTGAKASNRRTRARFYLQGSSHILEKPEFQDVEKARPIFRALEERDKLIDWIGNAAGDGVSVRIGQENDLEAFRECAVVTTRYGIQGERKGAVAVVGPKRMRYLQTISLVTSVAQGIGKILEERY